MLNNNNEFTFSIIIPTLNEEKTLPLLLNDINNQTYKNFEILIIDAKSSDNTAKLAKKYIGKSHLKIIISNKKSVNFQRNLGSKQARSSLLLFIDADIRLPDNFLKHLYESYLNSKTPIIIPQMFTSSKNILDKLIVFSLNIIYLLEKILNKKPLITECLMLIEKHCFLEVGGLNEKLHFHEGRDFLIRANKLNYQYSLIQSPKYEFSLRRYKKYGITNIITNNILSRINFKKNKTDYHPMTGGEMYEDKNSRTK